MPENREQLALFPRSTAPSIAVDPDHRLVRLTQELDWNELEAIVQIIRRRKLKSRAGRKPHLRVLIGAVLLMASRRMTYQKTEDQIRYYAPARYLCGLTECDWTPDFTTIQDFVELLGPDGMRQLNEYVVTKAVKERFADPQVVVADTTAQEAAIPYPNEVGLLTSFMTAVVLTCTKGNRVLREFVKGIEQHVTSFARQARHYRLFSKTKEAKDAAVGKLTRVVSKVKGKLGKVLGGLRENSSRTAKLVKLHATIDKLLPQIQSWLETGRVARGKVISIHCPELYSIVRGKIGKKVEFGLKWGMQRLGGGYLWSSGPGEHNFNDKHHAVQAIDDHIALFGKAPRIYAYDRGGYSPANVRTVKAKGVKHVGIAPTGRARWGLGPRIKRRVVQERCRIEGDFGALKQPRYGFNRPAARSTRMIAACGQRAILGLNMNKLVRDRARRNGAELVG